MRRSLVDQIVSAYLRQLGRDRPVKPLERMAANTYGASVADAQLRARLALGLFAGTPGKMRAFVATAAQARGRRLIAPAFARARQTEARALLRATLRLRTDLRRILATRRSFAR